MFDLIVKIWSMLKARLAPSPLSFEQLIIGNTAGGISLTASKYADAVKATIQVETAPIRVTIDGVTSPTTTVGKLFNSGDEIYLESVEEIANFKAIRTTSTSATINVDYSK